MTGWTGGRVTGRVSTSSPMIMVILAGILWGGSIEGEPEFVYSMMFNVERELGHLKTF